MDPNYNKDSIGSLKISEDVIASIARYAAKEIEGVADIGFKTGAHQGRFQDGASESGQNYPLGRCGHHQPERSGALRL